MKIVFYSGTDNTCRNRVAIVVNMTLENSIKEYRAVSIRIILVRYNPSPVDLNIILMYFPTSEALDDEVECYSQLELLEPLANVEITILIGGHNAKVRREPRHEHIHKVIVKYSLGEYERRTIVVILH